MKVHIFIQFKEDAWGGGNQFLKSLKKYLQSTGVYEEKVEKADVILFDSYQNAKEIARTKLSYPQKCMIHRIDGPIRLYNKKSDRRDYVTNITNRLIAQGTIFQSEWSQRQNLRLGLKKNAFDTIITNASDPAIFNRDRKIPFSTNRKVRLIATSWSSNPKKGFHVYKWLDENLDFNKYEMTFVGRSPIGFKNIRHILPLKSEQLSQQLKNNDIFIIASRNDPCSNALIEALHCGLPAIGFRDSGHPQIISKGGETFKVPGEIPGLVEKVTNNYYQYQANIHNPSMKKVGEQYYDFICFVYEQVQSGKSRVKSFGVIAYARVILTIYLWKLSTQMAVFRAKLIGRVVGIINRFSISK